MSLKQTTGYESVQQYIDTYGFCHWQAQEVIKVREAESQRIVELCFELDNLRQQIKQLQENDNASRL